MQLAGNGFSKMAQVIKHQGANIHVDLAFGRITSAPPDDSAYVISLDGSSIELEQDEFIVCGNVASTLAKGDKVAMLCIDAKSLYLVLDKVVRY